MGYPGFNPYHRGLPGHLIVFYIEINYFVTLIILLASAYYVLHNGI